MLDLGIDLGFAYASENAGVVSGGKRVGIDYTHSVAFQADVDWAKLAGMTGFSTHLAVIERAGRNTSSDYVGDHINDVQELYGGAGDVAAHLVYREPVDLPIATVAYGPKRDHDLPELHMGKSGAGAGATRSLFSDRGLSGQAQIRRPRRRRLVDLGQHRHTDPR